MRQQKNDAAGMPKSPHDRFFFTLPDGHNILAIGRLAESVDLIALKAQSASVHASVMQDLDWIEREIVALLALPAVHDDARLLNIKTVQEYVREMRRHADALVNVNAALPTGSDSIDRASGDDIAL